MNTPLHNGSVDLDTGVAHIDGADVRLTTLERRFLARLVEAGGEPVSASTLLVDVWEASPSSQTRTMEVLVRRLRKKLGESARAPVHLHTERGIGYRFVGLPSSTPTDALGWLVGRADLVEEVRRRSATHGLLTLVGPGGVGKTSVAKVALPDAVFVDLAGVEDAGGFHPMVRAALDLQDPTQDVLGALAGRHLLLDNMEQLPDSLATDVRKLADVAPVVVTSQRVLGCAGEQILRVPPLDSRDAEELLRRRVEGVGHASDDAIRRMVEQVGGVPLALEIMAPLLALAGDEAFAFEPLAVEQDAKGLPARQVSLQTVLDRSWSQRSREERATLADLALFMGRFDLHAAASVLAVPLPTALQRLRRLVDTSWLQVDNGVFQMLRSTRRFLQAHGASPEGRARHAHFLGSLALDGGHRRLARVARHANDLHGLLASAQGPLENIVLALVDHTLLTGDVERLVVSLQEARSRLPTVAPPAIDLLTSIFHRFRLRGSNRNEARQALLDLHHRGQASAYAYWGLATVADDEECAIAWSRAGLARLEEESLAVRIRMRPGLAMGTRDPDVAAAGLDTSYRQAEDAGMVEMLNRLKVARAHHALFFEGPERALEVLGTLDRASEAAEVYWPVLGPALLLTDRHAIATPEAKAYLERLPDGWRPSLAVIAVRVVVAVVEGRIDEALETLQGTAQSPARERGLLEVLRALTLGVAPIAVTDPVLMDLVEHLATGVPIPFLRSHPIASSALGWLQRHRPEPASGIRPR